MSPEPERGPCVVCGAAYTDGVLLKRVPLEARRPAFNSLAGWLCGVCASGLRPTRALPTVDVLADPFNPDPYAPWRKAGRVFPAGHPGHVEDPQG